MNTPKTPAKTQKCPMIQKCPVVTMSCPILKAGPGSCFFLIKLMNLTDVRGSVHHSIIHKENPTRCNSVSKFYFICIWSSTRFGRHTAHHQEPKTALAASGFAYVESLLDVQLLGAVSVQQLHAQQPSTYAKPEAASAVLGSWWSAVCRPKHIEL